MTKDWTGNKKTMSATLGASNLTEKERAEWDYYATPSRAIDAVVPYLNKDIPIWECACGGGISQKSWKKKVLRFSVPI